MAEAKSKQNKTCGKILKISFAICFMFYGCGISEKNSPAFLIERNAAFSPETKSDPLHLVVEIRRNGDLFLNKIQTGTVKDTELLSEKIKIIFDDRANNGIKERKVFIDPKWEIDKDDLNHLVKVLEHLQASPILIIKEN